MNARWDQPLTKRQLGALIMAGSLAGMLAVVSVDALGAGQFGGLGPAQQRALGGGALLFMFGATLWPLGARPA